LQSNYTCNLSETQIQKLDIVFYIDESLYGLTFVFLLYNCWWLLYQKGRWRNEQMIIFYTLSLLILISRLIFLVKYKKKEYIDDPKFGLFYVSEAIASYSKMCLGICQVIAMLELVMRLK